MTGIYIHIPFCRRRCLYCDFFTVGERKADWHPYVSALLEETACRLSMFGQRIMVNNFIGDNIDNDRTLYIGGGTPSLIPPDEFKRLCVGLKKLLGPVMEFTIEVNPDDVTHTLARTWKESGVNRISMGVQSLVDSELKTIGRRHDASTARRAMEILKNYFDNISLDIMFGLPYQTQDSLKTTLEGILELHPRHISAYSLMYEERSALTRLLQKGILEEMPEEDSFSMFEYLSRKLKESGYEQYEISNYALPRFQSQHNGLYWNSSPYLGIGPGAHGYDGKNCRYNNAHDIDAYIEFWNCRREDVENLEIPERISTCEILSSEELREEMIMTRLRTSKGINLAEFEKKFGEKARKKLMKCAARFIESGRMVDKEGRLFLSGEGFYVSDDIISSLF